jgi:hypothetical protein
MPSLRHGNARESSTLARATSRAAGRILDSKRHCRSATTRRHAAQVPPTRSVEQRLPAIPPATRIILRSPLCGHQITPNDGFPYAVRAAGHIMMAGTEGTLLAVPDASWAHDAATSADPIKVPFAATAGPHAFAEQLGGWASRSVFKGTADFAVEVSDLQVGPKRSLPVQSQGGSLYRVREGTASVIVGGKSQFSRRSVTCPSDRPAPPVRDKSPTRLTIRGAAEAATSATLTG